MSGAGGDPSQVQALAQALTDAAGEVGPVTTAAARTVADLTGSHLRGEGAQALEEYWHGTATVAGRVADVLSFAGQAVAGYAVAMTDARDLELRGVAVARTHALLLVAGRAQLPPDPTLMRPDLLLHQQDAVTRANVLFDQAEQTLEAAGRLLLRQLDALRAELGDHRRLLQDPDFQLAVSSTLAALYAAPTQVLTELTDKAGTVRAQTSQWARMLRSGNAAQRSQAGTLLKQTAADARALEAEADGAQWLDTLPGGSALGRSVGSLPVPWLEDLKYADDVPLLGAAFTVVGVGVDHYTLGQSWGEAVTGNVASMGAGIVVGAAVAGGVAAGLAAVGVAGVVAVGAPVVAAVVVGGAVAYGVGKGVDYVWENHAQLWRETQDAAGSVEHSAENAASAAGKAVSSAWDTATSWL